MKKYFPTLIMGAMLCMACGPKEKPVDEPVVTGNDSIVAAPDSSEVTEDAEQKSKETIEKCKAFLEAFYKQMDEDQLDYAYVRRNATRRALKYLTDNFDYDCESGDCLATWMFLYEGGGDTGGLEKRTIEAVNDSTYKISQIYDQDNNHHYRYVIRLGLVKDGDNYKIDTIEPLSSTYD